MSTRGDSDSQQEFQQEQRIMMGEVGVNFSRRFYAINAQPSCGDPTFVYLDEGDDPMVYQLLFPFLDDEFEIRSLDRTLSGYVNNAVQHIIDGWGI